MARCTTCMRKTQDSFFNCRLSLISLESKKCTMFTVFMLSSYSLTYKEHLRVPNYLIEHIIFNCKQRCSGKDSLQDGINRCIFFKVVHLRWNTCLSTWKRTCINFDTWQLKKLFLDHNLFGAITYLTALVKIFLNKNNPIAHLKTWQNL